MLNAPLSAPEAVSSAPKKASWLFAKIAGVAAGIGAVLNAAAQEPEAAKTKAATSAQVVPFGRQKPAFDRSAPLGKEQIAQLLEDLETGPPRLRITAEHQLTRQVADHGDANMLIEMLKDEPIVEINADGNDRTGRRMRVLRRGIEALVKDCLDKAGEVDVYPWGYEDKLFPESFKKKLKVKDGWVGYSSQVIWHFRRQVEQMGVPDKSPHYESHREAAKDALEALTDHWIREAILHHRSEQYIGNIPRSISDMRNAMREAEDDWRGKNSPLGRPHWKAPVRYK